MKEKEINSCNKRKVLVVLPSLNVRSGVSSHVMGYYRNICNEFDIDFAIYTPTDNDNTKEILANGDRIFCFKKGFLKSWISLRRFFKKNAKKYDIIHCHTFNYGLAYLKFAKKYGIKSRIIHIHSTEYSDGHIKAFLNKTFVRLCLRYANIYVACSKKAGDKAFRSRNYHIVNNGIDIDIFANGGRDSIREKLNIKDDEVLFGNVGRLVKTKNHLFTIKVFDDLRKSQKYRNSKLLLIGDGPELKQISAYIKQRKIEDSVIIISCAANIADYYAAMDCFIFPSINEGLGIAMIEAQASGLPCFCSNELPSEVFVTSLAHGLDLAIGAEAWSKIIMQTDLVKSNTKKQLIDVGFDIKTESRKMIEFYNGINVRNIHITHVIPTLSNGGTEKFLMNLIENTSGNYLNSIIVYDRQNEWADKLNQNNVAVTVIEKPSKTGVIKNIRMLKRCFKQSRPDIVYVYTSFNSAYVLLAAMLSGVRIRIAHSHTSATEHKKTITYRIYVIVSKILLSFVATHKLACSDKAGKAIFFGKYKVVQNGIYVDKYKYDEVSRNQLRKELRIDTKTTLIGTIGRLDKNKNQRFMIEVLNECIKRNMDTKLLIVGEGPERQYLEKYAKELDIIGNVIFIGSVRNVKKYYDAIDVFLLTSFNEGLPFVLIEAQANGLPILASDSIDKTVKINSNFKLLKLGDGQKIWAQEVSKNIGRIIPSKKINQYSIENTVKQVIDVYDSGED